MVQNGTYKCFTFELIATKVVKLREEIVSSKFPKCFHIVDWSVEIVNIGNLIKRSKSA